MNFPRHNTSLIVYIFFSLSVGFVLCSTATELDCQRLITQYQEVHYKESLPFSKSNLLHFLHVPRTAGKTFNSCFLRQGTVPERRCPKGYDHLRINLDVPSCHLLTSHDDFSIISTIHHNITVISQVRDPVDRLFSAYEFAVKGAARGLGLIKSINNTKPASKYDDKTRTENVWPWSYLIPFFSADMDMRRAKLNAEPQPETGNWIRVPEDDETPAFYYNKVRNISVWNVTPEESHLILPDLDMYDNPLVMSLREFVAHPIARELIHNGAAMQILGLTNYSHWPDANALRECLWTEPQVQHELLAIAERRMRLFPHVGTTDRLYESVESASISLEIPLDTEAYNGMEDIGSAKKPRRFLAEGTDEPRSDLEEEVKRVEQELRDKEKEVEVLKASSERGDEWHELKKQMGSLRRQLRSAQEALDKAPQAKGPEGGATGGQDVGGLTNDTAAVNPRWEKTMKLGRPLDVEFQVCANRSAGRARSDLSMLERFVMPDGRGVDFNKAKRHEVAESIINMIREYNQMDHVLHEVADELLTLRRAKQQAAGLLKSLTPQPEPPAVPRKIRRRRSKIPKPEDTEKSEL